MMPAPQDPAKAAIDWLTRQRDPLFDDWDEFTGWLEADPAHAAQYQRLMALDAAVAENLADDPPQHGDVSDAAPARPRRTLAGALAMGAAAAVAIAAFLTIRPDATYEVATAAGERKHILLADGSRIVLNGGTRMRFDREAPRTATLESGEALFDVVHDPRTRFRVTFDGGSVENLGTRFTVVRKRGDTEVAVAEGAVAYSGGENRIELRPGQRLVARDGMMAVQAVAIDRVGSWATPRLTYDDAPLRMVAADLSRELGAPVTVAPAVAEMRVTATIQLDLDVERSMARLGPLLDVHIGRRGDGWLISTAK